MDPYFRNQSYLEEASLSFGTHTAWLRRVFSLTGSKFEPVPSNLFIGSREAADYYLGVQTSLIERLDMYLC